MVKGHWVWLRFRLFFVWFRRKIFFDSQLTTKYLLTRATPRRQESKSGTCHYKSNFGIKIPKTWAAKY